MIKDYQPKPNWFERNAGLGGWVGAIGAVIAIFAAWWLARSEYQRALNLENERVNTEINLIQRTVEEFDPIVQAFIKLAKVNVADAKGMVYPNDPRTSRMVDFNTLPITQWPSVESYDAFRRYFFASEMLLQIPNNKDTASLLETDIDEYDGKFPKLIQALKDARK